jgi:lysophospholipase L1-like esterase
MNGRQARGWGISAHERTNTTTKKAANSIVGKLTAGILATAAVAATCLAAPAAAFQDGAGVLVIGDSLEVGSGPYLRHLLPGVTVDAEKGRTSSEGVRVLSSLLDPSVQVIVFPLGTNDSPSNAGGLAANLAAVRQLAGDRCVVVATISRPPVGGVSVGAINRVVEQFAGRPAARVADWRTVVASIPSLLVRDRVHATGEGYSVRATLLAEAVQGCQLGGAVGPSGIPAPRDPNARPPEAEAEPALVLSLDPLAALARAALRPIAGAFLAARTAATRAGPEPVLGAP